MNTPEPAVIARGVDLRSEAKGDTGLVQTLGGAVLEFRDHWIASDPILNQAKTPDA